MRTLIRKAPFATPAGLLSVVALAGCGNAPEAVVTGTVLVDGELAERGQVAFYPVSGGPPALATVRDDGSFVIAVGRGDKINPDKSKVAAGEYVVTVMVNGPNVPGEEGKPPSAGPRLSDAKYASRATSPLKQAVIDGPNIVVLDLDRAPVAELSEPEGKGVAEGDVDAGVADEGEVNAAPESEPSGSAEPDTDASETGGETPLEQATLSNAPQPASDAAPPAEPVTESDQ